MTGENARGIILRSELLSRIAGLEHGFGTKTAALTGDGFASLRQIHSAACLIATHPGCAGEGDALLTAQPGLPVSIRTADCLPVLVADPVARAVAAVHAGWRGTVARVVPSAVRRMQEQFGSRPADLVAAIGPGIGVCCYQVGEDVGRQFGLSGAGCVNLSSENRRQLVEAGVPEPQIDILEICTFCDSRFHSFRRDKDRAGRMISFIRLPPAP